MHALIGFNLGTSIKDVRSQGGCPVRTFFGKGEFFGCGHSHFLVQKNPDYSKFLVCPHGQGRSGLSQCGRCADKRKGGSIFQDFLWTAPY